MKGYCLVVVVALRGDVATAAAVASAQVLKTKMIYEVSCIAVIFPLSEDHFDMSNSDELRHTDNTTLIPPRLPDTLPQVYHRRRPTLGLLILPSVPSFSPTIRRTARISVLPIEPNLAERARISAINLDDYQLDPVTPPPSPSSPFSMAAYQRMIAETDPTQREEALTAYGTETGQSSVPVPETALTVCTTRLRGQLHTSLEDMDHYSNAYLEELEAFLPLWDDRASNAQEEARQKRKEALEKVVQQIYLMHENFHGTEGAVGLTRWFKKLESQFGISSVAEGDIVKFASSTLLDGALTWWNMYVHSVTLDTAYATPWSDFKAMFIRKYCPRNEVKQMENELWNLKEKTLVTSGNGTETTTTTTTPTPPVISIRTNVQRQQGCLQLGKVGHKAKDCRALPRPVSQRGPGSQGGQGSDVTCFGCDEKGHYKNNKYIDIPPTALDTNFSVELADGKSLTTSTILRRCTLNLQNHLFKIDLLPIELGSFDVIIGMDWMAEHRVEVVCYEKYIHVPYRNDMLIIQGERSGIKNESRLKVISSIRTQKYTDQGCQVFLIQMMKEEETKILERRIKDVLVVRDFPEFTGDVVSVGLLNISFFVDVRGGNLGIWGFHLYMGLDRTRLLRERWETEDVVDKVKVSSEFHNIKLLVKLPKKHCIAVRYTIDGGNSMAPKSIAAISHDEREELRRKGIKSPSKLISPKYLSPASIKELNKNPTAPKRAHFVNSIVILSTNSDTEEEDISTTNACDLNLGSMVKGKEDTHLYTEHGIMRRNSGD
ncbi:putative reverse transcriptase domain-containing protein [Tanacetum coccineum]